ncbi:hypothetical protein POX_e06648 [Penicillium oxalicum]|uniref:hypothetical protein n=1 Tax=Penicillium oxalicum TaxID=69781 RepID=UPI0020B88601|nr:hypothetical protein POX_e06648 [Penicillium oxalicum]KAI2788627.1 hypothetical protein POX_e06648 [Penicillium oxalicum]
MPPAKKSLAGLPPAPSTGAVEMPASLDTRTSRTGRVIKAPTPFVPPPTVAGTGKRKGVSRKKEANVVCIHCNRGQSPASNAIVFCDGCNSTWHQKCHDPPIDNQVILVRDMEWHCRRCKPVRRPSVAKTKIVKTKKATRTLHPRLQAAPHLEVGGERFTSDERRAYLSRLSHAQLVELLVNVSNRHPSVPMFPANMKDRPASQFFLRPRATVSTNSNETHAEFKLRSKKRTCSEDDVTDANPYTSSRKKPRTASSSTELSANKTSTSLDDCISSSSKGISADPAPNLTALSHTNHSSNETRTSTTGNSRSQRASFTSQETPSDTSEPDTDDETFEDAVEDHRLYPLAGNGFMPTMDPRDLGLLTESSQSQTFSHSIHGPAQKAHDTGAPPPVWRGLV